MSQCGAYSLPQGQASHSANMEKWMLMSIRTSCGSFPRASPSQPVCSTQNSAPHYTAKLVKQFLKAENIYVKKWPVDSPNLNPNMNFWKAFKDKIMADKPTTVPKSCNKLEDKCNKIKLEQHEKLVMCRQGWYVNHRKQGPLCFLFISKL